MTITIIENVKATDLPCAWVQKSGEDETQIFDVVLKPKKNKRSQKAILKRWDKMRKKIGDVKPLARDEIYTR